MKQRFRFLAVADKEYREAVKYYVDNAGVKIADNFIDKVDAVIELIEDYPESGRILDEIEGVRSSRVPNFPYRIFYAVEHPDGRGRLV
jgi:plasmid stabilization system protein ParE